MSFGIHVISLFPELFETFFDKGLLGQAVKSQRLNIQLINPREFTTDVHRTVDDRPFGGGDGMVMKAEPLQKSILRSLEWNPSQKLIYLTPQGIPLNQRICKTLSESSGLTLICGRYGGIDDRLMRIYDIQEISIGDYVLNGGEVAAMAVIESVTRLIPGFMGNSESPENDSFSNGILEGPSFTRPAEFQGWVVPSFLTSGNHKQIEKNRKLVAWLRTWDRRPDLINTPELKAMIGEARQFLLALAENEREVLGLNTRNLTDFAKGANTNA